MLGKMVNFEKVRYDIAQRAVLGFVEQVITGKKSIFDYMNGVVLDAHSNISLAIEENNIDRYGHNELFFGVGESIDAALQHWASFHKERGPIEITEVYKENGKEFDWGCRFTSNGTCCKAAGKVINGAYVITWWK